MRRTLPSGISDKLGIVFGLVILFGACKHVVKETPVAPGKPIPAEADTDLENMDTECAGLVAALDTYGKCPNHKDRDREWTRRAIEIAEQSFAAAKKSNPDEPSQRAIAAACHRAAQSMRYATQRCLAGPRPKTEEDYQ